MKLITNSNIVIFIGLFIISFSAISQNRREIKEADKLYEHYAYVDATKIYEKIADKGYMSKDILQKLGNSFFFRADYPSAYKWYKILFDKANQKEYEGIEPEYYYRYALCLKSMGQYGESNTIMDKFVELVGGNDRRAVLFKSNKDYLAEIEKNSGRVDITTTGINTKFSEYGPAFYLDNIVFTANRKPGFLDKVSQWTNEGMYNIYITKRKGDSISNEVKINPRINTKLNESTATFTKDGNTVYFTRNDLYVDKKGDKNILLKLYRAERDRSGNWLNVKELPFSSAAYNVAHPALSPDEKYLYFASNMPGTYGESDIFRVEIKDDGTYGKPENLGETINTGARETFPFITSENVLYFASDGFPGLGGLDIYASQIGEDNKLGPCQNIGRPINSPYDDFSMILDDETGIGYFASNRPGGKGSDDIYCINQKVPLVLRCTKLIRGIVKDSITGEVLADAVVDLKDKLFTEKGSTTTGKEGTFSFEEGLVFCEEGYSYIKTSKEGYNTKESKVSLEGDSNTIYHEVLLTPIKQKINKGDDLAKIFRIKNIYFDFDKSNIRPKAEVQLSQIVEVMKENPGMVIEVKSHTDSRGSRKYNERLSDRRAKSTINWIISQGISPDRIFGRGYGEEEILNGCVDGVKCTKEEHAVNRRSEFIIVKL